ncbi:unnamed protein product [Lampetra fluviatilis]
MEETEIWEQYTVNLNRAPGMGFGIAVSGGKDNPHFQSGETSIVISDVLQGSPADGLLDENDRVVMVNGVSMDNVDHAFAVQQLRKSGKTAQITVRRKKLVQIPISRRMDPQLQPRRDLDRLDLQRHHDDDDEDDDMDVGFHPDDDDDRRNHRSGRSPVRSGRRSREYGLDQVGRRSRDPSVDRDNRRSWERSLDRGGGGGGGGGGRQRSVDRSRERSLDRDRAAPRGRIWSQGRSQSMGTLDSTSPVRPQRPIKVTLVKSKPSEGYGLRLGSHIYVKDIGNDGLAARDGNIQEGDIVLKINGTVTENMSLADARKLIEKSKGKLKLVVQRDERKTLTNMPELDDSPPSSDGSDHSDISDIRSLKSDRSDRSDRSNGDNARSGPRPRSPRDDRGSGQSDRGSASQPTSSVGQVLATDSLTCPTEHFDGPDVDLPPGLTEVPNDDDQLFSPEVKLVQFKKGDSVGLRLAGGNDVGIFVAGVQDGSPAAQQGLDEGDQILSVNNVDFRNIVREEAVLYLLELPKGEEVLVHAQRKRDVYRRVVESDVGDSFYIRTHFDYEKENPYGLSFLRGEVFRVVDTLYNGKLGSWLAIRIGRNNQEVERGIIPNKNRAEQLATVQNFAKVGTNDRADFWRFRGLRSAKKNLRKSREDLSAQPVPTKFPAYERVVLREAGFLRPVVIFGPIADVARDKLAREQPNSFEIARNEPRDAGTDTKNSGVIRLHTIKEIIDKDKHALLDITPGAVDRLNYAQWYPIVLFLNPDSKSGVKTMRTRLCPESRKSARKLHERAAKLRKSNWHLFTSVINLNSMNEGWYGALKDSVAEQQNQLVWVSEGRADGDTDDLDMQDDRISHLSAPLSELSLYSDSRVTSDCEDTDTEGGIYTDQELDETMNETDTEPVLGMPVAGMPSAVSRSSEPVRDEAPFGRPSPEPGAPKPRLPRTTSREMLAEPSPPSSYDSASQRANDNAQRQYGSLQRNYQQPHSFDDGDVRSHEAQPSRSQFSAAPAPPSATEPPRQATIKVPPPAPATNPPREDSDSEPVIPKSVLGRVKMFEKQQPKRVVRTRDGRGWCSYPARSADGDFSPLQVDIHVAQPVPPLTHAAQQSTQTYRAGEAPRLQVKPADDLRPVNRYSNSQDEDEDEAAGYRTQLGLFSRQDPPAPKPSEPPAQSAFAAHNRYGAHGRRFRNLPKAVSLSRENVPTIQAKPDPPQLATKPSFPVQKPFQSGPASVATTQPSVNGSTPAPYKANPTPYTARYPPPSISERSLICSLSALSYSRFTPGTAKPFQRKFDSPKFIHNLLPNDADSSGLRPSSQQYEPASINITTKPQEPSKQQFQSETMTVAPKAIPVSSSALEDESHTVLATARGVFDTHGGVLSSVETGVSIIIPKGAIPPAVEQEIYFKVCKDNSILPPLDKEKGETLLSPLVMCGPHGLKFLKPVELRLPHCNKIANIDFLFIAGEPSNWQKASDPNYKGANCVSVLIDHF